MKNEKYSHKSFTNKTFINENLEDFTGEIYGSCFYQENKPNSIIFPEGINCKFINCNLDNVLVPENCILENCTNKKIQVQEDGFDWILDENNNPIEKIGVI